MEATQAIAHFATDSRPLAHSPGVGRAAVRAIVDTLGVALAGSAEPIARTLASHATQHAGAGECTLWGQNARASADQAALVNAAAVHALDFDDISHTMRGRPSAAVLPAVLALGERFHASGSQVMAAYVVGVEVACKLGKLSAQTSYERGWQTSCTLGVIGAAAACSRLLALDTHQTAHALGLAVAQASGSRRGFGSDAKPFQVGRASQSGVLSAELARLGVTAGGGAIEGEAGYFDLYANRSAGEKLEEMLGQPFDLESPGFNIKLYPCGGAAHASIDALLSLAHGVTAQDVLKVIVDVPYTAPLIAHQHRPQRGQEAKFSLEYCLAAAILDGEVGLAQFSDAAVLRPEAQALLRRVEPRVPPDMQKDALPWPPLVESRVELHLASGEVRRGVTVVRRGQGVQTPLSPHELEAKFLGCARMGVGDERALRILALINELQALPDLGELTRALA